MCEWRVLFCVVSRLGNPCGTIPSSFLRCIIAASSSGASSQRRARRRIAERALDFKGLLPFPPMFFLLSSLHSCHSVSLGVEALSASVSVFRTPKDPFRITPACSTTSSTHRMAFAGKTVFVQVSFVQALCRRADQSRDAVDPEVREGSDWLSPRDWLERVQISRSRQRRTLLLFCRCLALLTDDASRRATPHAKVKIAPVQERLEADSISIQLAGTIYTAAEEIEKAGGKALPCVVDIRQPESVEKVSRARPVHPRLG